MAVDYKTIDPKKIRCPYCQEVGQVFKTGFQRNLYEFETLQKFKCGACRKNFTESKLANLAIVNKKSPVIEKSPALKVAGRAIAEKVVTKEDIDKLFREAKDEELPWLNMAAQLWKENPKAGRPTVEREVRKVCGKAPSHAKLDIIKAAAKLGLI